MPEPSAMRAAFLIGVKYPISNSNAPVPSRIEAAMGMIG
jgi:hypothetical protein